MKHLMGLPFYQGEYIYHERYAVVGANIVDNALTKNFNYGLKTVIPKKLILCVFIIYLLFLV